MPKWIPVCAVSDVEPEDVFGFESDGLSYALYRAPDGQFFATEGRCSHEDVKLCDGLVLGFLIECPKHNGQFDYRTGEAKRAPACKDIRTYPVKTENGSVFVEVD